MVSGVAKPSRTARLTTAGCWSAVRKTVAGKANSHAQIKCQQSTLSMLRNPSLHAIMKIYLAMEKLADRGEQECDWMKQQLMPQQLQRTYLIEDLQHSIAQWLSLAAL